MPYANLLMFMELILNCRNPCTVLFEFMMYVLQNSEDTAEHIGVGHIFSHDWWKLIRWARVEQHWSSFDISKAEAETETGGFEGGIASRVSFLT